MSPLPLQALLLLTLAPCAAAAGTLNGHPSGAHEARAEPFAAPPPDGVGAAIGGRSEGEWRDAALALQRALESAEATLASCEAREAPAPIRDVSGYVASGRRGPYWVEIKSCDEERVDAQDAGRAVTDFEEQARRLSVPPGWMR